MVYDYEKFKGTTHWREDAFSDNLEHGLLAWLRWSMLNVGGFENVSAASEDGLYGGNMATLKVADDPNYTLGQVWESQRSDWVWETGVSPTLQPVQPSGVYIDDEFFDDTEVDFSVDYTRGRIIFDTKLSTKSEVKTDYSYRIPTIGLAKEPVFQELMYQSLDAYKDNAGDMNRFAQARRTMPTIGIEIAGRKKYKPFQLGGGQWVYQDIILYVIAENSNDRNKLVNILCNQNDKVIYLIDKAKLKTDGVYPYDLDIGGSPVASPLQYPDLVSQYDWSRVRLIEASGEGFQSTTDWLWRGNVKITCEAIFTNI